MGLAERGPLDSMLLMSVWSSSHEERTRRWGPLPCFSRLSRNLTMPARPQTHSWEEGRREKGGGGKRDALIGAH